MDNEKEYDVDLEGMHAGLREKILLIKNKTRRKRLLGKLSKLVKRVESNKVEMMEERHAV